jgi:carotenoid cleavage dioxygenase-like enzyme
VRHNIETDKKKFENIFGNITKSPLYHLLVFLNRLGLFPNIAGSANTALTSVDKRLFVLYETDKPYELSLDFQRSVIYTKGKTFHSSFNTFSAHSKQKDQMIHNVEYSVFNKTVKYSVLDRNFRKIRSKEIKTHYSPFVHDFVLTDTSLIVVNSPLDFNIQNAFAGKFPLKASSQRTYIYDIVLNKQYLCNESFFVFHYADVKETDSYINIYAPIYNSFDLDNTIIKSSYQRIVLDKKHDRVTRQIIQALSDYNLDFPKKINKRQVLLYNLNTKKEIDALVICEGVRVVKIYRLTDLFYCGEPGVIDIGNTQYTIGLSKDIFQKKYVLLINLRTFEKIRIPIDTEINMGFHSIFIPSSEVQ